MNLLAAILTFVFRAGVVLAFAVIVAAVTVQVVSRNFLPFSPAWTEELTRFALLYLAAIGIGLAYRSGDLVGLDFVVEAMPERLGWLLRLAGAVLVCWLAVTLIEPAWRFVRIGRLQTSPVLGVRMTWIHASMIVLLTGLALFSALRVLEMLTGRSDGRPALPEDMPHPSPDPRLRTPRPRP